MNSWKLFNPHRDGRCCLLFYISIRVMVLPSARGLPLCLSIMRPFQGAHSTPHSWVIAKALVYWLTAGTNKMDKRQSPPKYETWWFKRHQKHGVLVCKSLHLLCKISQFINEAEFRHWCIFKVPNACWFSKITFKCLELNWVMWCLCDYPVRTLQLWASAAWGLGCQWTGNAWAASLTAKADATWRTWTANSHGNSSLRETGDQRWGKKAKR